METRKTSIATRLERGCEMKRTKGTRKHPIYFFIRVSPEMKTAFEKLCDSRDEAVAAAVRRLIVEELRREEPRRKQ
jgi:hypothetical protein